MYNDAHHHVYINRTVRIVYEHVMYSYSIYYRDSELSRSPRYSSLSCSVLQVTQIHVYSMTYTSHIQYTMQLTA